MSTPDAPDQGPPTPGTPAAVSNPYPQYPAYQYSYPPPPKRPWLWVAVGAAVVGALSILGLAVWGLSSLPDDPGGSDYLVDQSRVLDATEKPCEAMVKSGLSISIFAGPTEGAQSLTRYVSTLRAVSAAVDSARPNADARQWSADVTALADSLDSYAKSLAKDATLHYRMPRPAQESITGRMDAGSPVGCEIPVAIDALDPAAAADYYDN